MTLPLNTYTQWYWKVDLHNLMHFLSLRFDYHAQYEIRVYAEIILNIMKDWVPITYEAFLKHRVNNFTLSEEGVRYLKQLISDDKNIKIEISKRERDEINYKFGLS